MRVLITGVTARMIGSQRLKYEYMSNVSIIEECLRRRGHVVTTRKTHIREDLRSQYDVALVGMAPIFSLGAGYFPEAAGVLTQMGSRAALYADDWSFVGFGDTVRGALKGWDKYLAWRKFKEDTKRGITDDDLSNLREVLTVITGETCPWKTFVPMFNFGKPKEFMEGNIRSTAVPFDPSPIYKVPKFRVIPTKKRMKVWVSAALGDHSSWIKSLKLTWPILEYGNKRKEQEILTETEVIQKYAIGFGVLAAKYPKAGCGWWRVRYCHAAATESVLLCDPEDGKNIGPTYCIDPDLLEQLSKDSLREMAIQQRAELRRYELHPDEVAQYLSRQVEVLA